MVSRPGFAPRRPVCRTGTFLLRHAGEKWRKAEEMLPIPCCGTISLAPSPGALVRLTFQKWYRGQDLHPQHLRFELRPTFKEWLPDNDLHVNFRSSELRVLLVRRPGNKMEPLTGTAPESHALRKRGFL